MSFVSAKVIEDSYFGEFNQSFDNQGYMRRLITLQLKYPRFIHAEFMTHRMFSRNASSSRAIPVHKVIEQVRNDPAMPNHWGLNQAGMQADKEVEQQVKERAIACWKQASVQAATIAEQMMKDGLHKQVANRLLEPFQYMHVVVTATEWNNFFELRDHDDAEPNIHDLAIAMKEAIQLSEPRNRYGEKQNMSAWHLPYVSDFERKVLNVDTAIKASVARCARVSYVNHDGSQPDIEKDLALYDRLVGSKPAHASPTEHQAMPNYNYSNFFFYNLMGWLSHRYYLEN